MKKYILLISLLWLTNSFCAIQQNPELSEHDSQKIKTNEIDTSKINIDTLTKNELLVVILYNHENIQNYKQSIFDYIEKHQVIPEQQSNHQGLIWLQDKVKEYCEQTIKAAALFEKKFSTSSAQLSDFEQRFQ